MPLGDDKIRLQTVVPKQLAERVRAWAKANGQSESSLIALILDEVSRECGDDLVVESRVKIVRPKRPRSRK